MKPGDKVYMATTTGIDEYYFVAFDGIKAQLTCQSNEVEVIACRSYGDYERRISVRHGGFWVRKSHVFPTYKEAVQFRIELLKKSIRTMETTTANHQRTIRQLQRELRESSNC